MDSNNIDLDLSKISNEEHDKLAQAVESFYKKDSYLKHQLSVNWERNHLMLDGKQWLVYTGNNEASQSQWSELKVSKANDYIPRPVTNYLFDIYQTLKSYLIQNKPRSSVKPNTQSWSDKMASKIAELVMEANWERLVERANYEQAAACVGVYGTAIKKDYWDTSTPNIISVPQLDEMGAEMIDPETGAPAMQSIPLGDVNTAVIDPYRFILDPLADNLHNLRWCGDYTIMPIPQIVENYSKQEPGYTGLAEQVKPEKYLSSSMRRYYELKTSSGAKGFGAGFPGSGSGSDEMIENAAIVKEIYIEPSQQYPKGRLVVVANGKTLFAGDSPYEGTELGDWHPYSEARWEILPGRFWGRAPIDDAIEMQKRINSIDATIVLVRKTMAIPQRLVPKGSIKRGEWTGRPGQNIEYRPIEGAKPETVTPSNVASQVFEERRQLVEDLKQITGAIDILKGDRPPGVTAASALEMLFEVGTGKLRPALDRWKYFIESSQKKQLKLTANKYKEVRPEFVKRLKKLNKEIPDELLDRFIGSDIRDNTNITIEASSNIPKLQSAYKAYLIQAAQIGVLTLENPENRMKFLEDLGITGYSKDISPDVKRAEYENDLMQEFENNPAQQVHPVVLLVDDHSVHKEIHARFMKSLQFMQLSPPVQQMFMQHYEEHLQQEEMQMQQQQMATMMGGEPPQKPQPQTKVAGAGKGIPADVQEKLMGAELPKVS